MTVPIVAPRLPDAPEVYSRDHMDALLRALTAYFLQAANAGSIRGTTILLTDLPTSSAGLPSGSVWRDAGASNVLKVVP